MNERLLPFAGRLGFPMPPNKNQNTKCRTLMKYPALFATQVDDEDLDAEFMAILQYDYGKLNRGWNKIHQFPVGRRRCGKVMVNNRFLYIISSVDNIIPNRRGHGRN